MCFVLGSNPNTEDNGHPEREPEQGNWENMVSKLNYKVC